MIGVGTAGILSLTHFCTWLDSSWEVFSIYDPSKPILGIGESTNGGFASLLQRGLHFSLGNKDDLDALDATLKFGSHFIDWRKEAFHNPLLDGDVAIHFNNFYLKDYAFERLAKIWPKQFRFLEGEVQKLSNRPDKVTVTLDGEDHDFDYLVDCTGFPKSFDGYTLSDCSTVTRCLVHSIEGYDGKQFTDHIAHEHGWMFGVPLQSRKTYGYLYNHKLTDKETAAADMMRLLNVDDLDDDAETGKQICKEYPFTSYYANDLVEGRICKNGNRAMFFEPLVANSIFIYIAAVQLFFDHIVGRLDRANTNLQFRLAVQQLEDTISFYYHGGSIYDTPFWRDARQATASRLRRRQHFHQIMRIYRAKKVQGTLYTAPSYAFAAQSWELIDERLNFNYIGSKSGETFDQFLTAGVY